MVNLTQAKYIAPSGNEHNLSWQEVERKVAHAVAVGDYPQFSGGDVIDLGHTIEEYPLSCRFYGNDYQAKSDAFFESLKEQGSAVLEHPRWGSLSVIPKEATQSESYIDGIGLSVVEVSFIITGETIELRINADGKEIYQHERKTPRTLDADPQIIKKNNSIAQKSLIDKLKINPPSTSVFTKFNKAILAPLKIVNNLLGNGWRLAGEWQRSFGALELAINGLLGSPQHVIDLVGAFLSPIKNLSKGERMQFLANMDKAFLSQKNSRLNNSTIENIQSSPAIIAQASGTTISNSMLVMSAISLAVESHEDLTSRDEASDLLINMQAIEKAYSLVNQELFEEITIESPEINVELVRVIAMNFSITKAIIFNRMAKLKLKMSRTIRHDMSLLEASFLLYGSIGDEEIEQLISLNNLNDDEIFLLPAGKELHYYG